MMIGYRQGYIGLFVNCFFLLMEDEFQTRSAIFKQWNSRLDLFDQLFVVSQHYFLMKKKKGTVLSSIIIRSYIYWQLISYSVGLVFPVRNA